MIACHAGDWYVDETRRHRLSVDFARAAHFRQKARRHVEQPQELVVPLLRVDVEEHRPRRVAHVGGVLPAASQLPDQPRVNGAECEPARGGPFAGPRNVVEQPTNLAGREIRIDEQARFFLHERTRAVGLQLFAELRGPAILPDDRVMNRVAGGAVPDDRGLALVGDPDSRDLARFESRAAERLDGHADLRRPDFLRVVLDPPGLRKDLLEFFLRDRFDGAVAIEHDGAGTRGPLVEGEEIIHGHVARRRSGETRASLQ